MARPACAPRLGPASLPPAVRAGPAFGGRRSAPPGARSTHTGGRLLRDGLAGAFGFEREHYDVSMRIGEHLLLPAVRAAPDEALIVADGFSRREQIAHATSRRALHLAEVLHAAARQERGEELPRVCMERDYWGREEIPQAVPYGS